MIMFMLQFIMFCVGIHVAKDVIKIGGAWIREILSAIDPEKIKERRERKELMTRFEQIATTTDNAGKENKED